MATGARVSDSACGEGTHRLLTELTVQHELFGDGCSLRVGEQGVTREKRSGKDRALTSAPKVSRACKMNRGNRSRSVTSVARICGGNRRTHVSREGRAAARATAKGALYQVGGARFVGRVAQDEILLH